MNHDDTLRRLLHDEADHVEPRLSFADVVRRADRESRRIRFRRIMLAAAAAVALIALSVPVISSLGRDGADTITESPDESPAVTPTVTSTSAPIESPTPVDNFEVLGVWPFVNGDDGDDWPGPSEDDRRDYTDPVQAAEGFLHDYIGAVTLDVGEFLQGDARSGEVVATEPLTGLETVVLVRQLGSSDAWTVIGASADRLSLDAPGAGDTVASPVAVSGMVAAFEGNVVVEVRARAAEGQPIGGGTAIGGAAATPEPFEVAIGLDPGLPVGPGAVVATTSSARDGAIEQVAAVPVTIGEPESAPDEAPDLGLGELSLPAGEPLPADQAVVVVTDRGGELPIQRILVIDVGDGSEVRTLADGLDTSEGGIVDLTLTADRRTVLVTVGTTACDTVVDAVAADGSSGLSPSGLGAGEVIAISPVGSAIAVAGNDGCGVAPQIVVWRAPDEAVAYGEDSGLEAAGLTSGSTEGLPSRVVSMAWADSQTLLYVVRYEDGTALFRLSLAEAMSTRLLGDELDIDWSSLAYHSPGVVAAVRTCCVGAPTRAELVLIDSVRGELLADSTDLDAAVPVVRTYWRSAEDPESRIWLDGADDLWKLTAGSPTLIRSGVEGVTG